MTCWRENRQKQRSSCESEGGWTSFLSSGNHVDPVDESLSQRTRRDTPRGKPPTCPSRGVNAELWPHNLRSVNTHTGKVQTRGVFFKGGWWRGDGVVVWGERPSHTQWQAKACNMQSSPIPALRDVTPQGVAGSWRTTWPGNSPLQGGKASSWWFKSG